MDPICYNKELLDGKNENDLDNIFLWSLLWSPLASITHWMPEWFSNFLQCKSKPLSLVSLTFQYRIEVSLGLGAWFKTELSLCSSGRKRKKCEQKFFLSLRSLWSWPLFQRRSWKAQRCWCRFIEKVCSSEANYPALLACWVFSSQMTV
jgi:hypothetical protein